MKFIMTQSIRLKYTSPCRALEFTVMGEGSPIWKLVWGGTDILARDDPPSIKPLVSPVFKKSQHALPI